MKDDKHTGRIYECLMKSFLGQCAGENIYECLMKSFLGQCAGENSSIVSRTSTLILGG
jgi:hypothetical protein